MPSTDHEPSRAQEGIEGAVTRRWRFDPDLVTGSELEPVKRWLEANDVDPRDVPTDAWVEFAGDEFTLEVYLRNDRGSLFARDGEERAARGILRNPLRVPPPAFRSLNLEPAEG